MIRMRQVSAFLAALLLAVQPAAATPRKAIVQGATTPTQVIQATDTLQLPAGATTNAPLNVPQGVAPTSPTNGDIWTTSTGLFVRANGATAGPLTANTGTVTSVTCGTALNGGTITTTGTCDLANTAVTPGSYTAANITVDAQGRVTAAANGAGGINQLTGDGTAGPGTGSQALTLATVNSNVGTFGDATHVVQFTVNGKGLITAAADVAISAATCANPCVIGSAQVAAGAGAPSGTYPRGSITMRTDVPRAYLSLAPTSTVPARVQEITAGGTYAVTLGTAPVPGNYLVALCYVDVAAGSPPSVNTGWTSIASYTSVSTNPHARLAYHLVVSGDTTSQTACSGTPGTRAGVAVKEVSGLDPTWANSFQASSFAGSTGFDSTISGTTSANNTLGLSFAGWYGTAATGVLTQSGSGWSNSTQTNNTGANSQSTASQFFASSGASYTSTYNFISGFPPTTAVVFVQPPNAVNQGAIPLSGLSTIQAAGSDISTDPRKINFSTGLTATDSLGTITVTTPATVVNTTGSPTTGALTKFSGAATVTSGDLSGDCTTSSTLAITCTKTGGVAFGTMATGNFATPSAIGNTTPAAGKFTTLQATGNITTNITGVAANCLRVDTSGVISGVGADCATGGSGTVTSVSGGAGLSGTVTTTGNITLGYGVLPQGRLTLTSGSPVMSADATAQGTIYYAPYQGSIVPIYSGSEWVGKSFSQITYVLNTTAHASGSLYDVFAYDNSGTVALCTGPAWTNSTTRSAAISQTNGVWANTSTLTCNLTNSTSTTSISATQATYLGTFYATANGQTGMAFKPSATGGGNNNFLGVYNAYNRVRTTAISRDSTASWTTTSTSWQVANIGGTGSGLNNRITWIDGLAQSQVYASYNVTTDGVTAATAAFIAIDFDSTTATPNFSALQANSSDINVEADDTLAPTLGLHFAQAIQRSSSGTVTFRGVANGSERNQRVLVTLDM